jgi:hypothetical protein
MNKNDYEQSILITLVVKMEEQLKKKYFALGDAPQNINNDFFSMGLENYFKVKLEYIIQTQSQIQKKKNTSVITSVSPLEIDKEMEIFSVVVEFIEFINETVLGKCFNIPVITSDNSIKINYITKRNYIILVKFYETQIEEFIRMLWNKYEKMFAAYSLDKVRANYSMERILSTQVSSLDIKTVNAISNELKAMCGSIQTLNECINSLKSKNPSFDLSKINAFDLEKKVKTLYYNEINFLIRELTFNIFMIETKTMSALTDEINSGVKKLNPFTKSHKGSNSEDFSSGGGFNMGGPLQK